MTSMNVVFRPSSKGDNSPGSLSLRFIRQRKVKAITLSDCRLYPSEWNPKKQTVVYPKDDPVRTTYLEEVEIRIRHELEIICGHIRLLEKQGHYTVDDILHQYREKKDEHTLRGYAELLARKMEQQGQERTARAYRTVTRGLVLFNGNEDIPLEQINARLIQGFEKHLEGKEREPNTISYYMRNLRAIYNKAICSGRITPDRSGSPFAGVYTGVAKTTKRALTLDEVHQLHRLDFTSPTEEEESISQRIRRESFFRAWRYFFFCLHARGMSFVDMAYLKKKDLEAGVLKYQRRKTGSPIEMGLTKELQRIIDSFSEETAGSPYVFPVIKDGSKKERLWYENALRVQNRHLKTLASLAGISKRVSTHVTRHTWATIGKQKNVPLRILSDCLGHRSEHTTQIYLGLLDNTELDYANALINSAILGKAFKGGAAFRF